MCFCCGLSADLSRNNITALAPDNFKGQEHLDELDLSHNKINGLTSWVFANLKVNYDNLFNSTSISINDKSYVEAIARQINIGEREREEKKINGEWQAHRIYVLPALKLDNLIKYRSFSLDNRLNVHHLQFTQTNMFLASFL